MGQDSGRSAKTDRLEARPHLTRADEDVAEARVGVTPEDHLAAGKADAIDHGTSGGEARPKPRRSQGGEGEV